MKTELKAKFLQHILAKKNGDEGFTLIELLVVIIIIGILSAIALPSFLNQANKAKQSEAKTYTGSLNRAQQAYFLENTAFTSDISALGIGIQTQTVNYAYTVTGTYSGTGAVVTNRASVNTAGAPLKSYVGGVEVTNVGATSEATTIGVLCEALLPLSSSGSNASSVTFATTSGALTCPAGFTSLAK
ncbi:type IV pilin-like G/H family protein [Nostoc sp.]|uniref:type IV pilin-like G/H family protein n=1 Tax=Nostoc sp. TaxID=1180 RepID=UPI002FF82E3C